MGRSPFTTNNRMELAGAIEGLKRLKEDLFGRNRHRFRIFAQRHDQLDYRLETQWLEDFQQEAGGEQGSLDHLWTNW